MNGFMSPSHCVCQAPHLYKEDAKVYTLQGLVGIQRDETYKMLINILDTGQMVLGFTVITSVVTNMYLHRD